MSTRDSQRSLLYEAEQELRLIFDNGGTIEHFGSLLVVPGERKFGDVADVAPYIDKVLALGAVAALPRAKYPVRVRERRGAAKAHYEYATATIALPAYSNNNGGRKGWALREVVVLHELAHHLVGPGLAGHGPEFVAMFAHLLECAIGPEAAHLLRVACWNRGITIATSVA